MAHIAVALVGVALVHVGAQDVVEVDRAALHAGVDLLELAGGGAGARDGGGDVVAALLDLLGEGDLLLARQQGDLAHFHEVEAHGVVNLGALVIVLLDFVDPALDVGGLVRILFVVGVVGRLRLVGLRDDFLVVEHLDVEFLEFVEEGLHVRRTHIVGQEFVDVSIGEVALFPAEVYQLLKVIGA